MLVHFMSTASELWIVVCDLESTGCHLWDAAIGTTG